MYANNSLVRFLMYNDYDLYKISTIHRYDLDFK